ncbi:hypothetical protein UC8_24360 [Roseimaritima ulvae]|uniref:Uncharacterized protein n=1 Tax=Roseimaritima ulvae TaxID=980254 RepID=A0A5B9QN87_9BACT|nr:hypothetical protein UC8_24360 [Roseimaritima ulvae]
MVAQSGRSPEELENSLGEDGLRRLVALAQIEGWGDASNAETARIEAAVHNAVMVLGMLMGVKIPEEMFKHPEKCMARFAFERRERQQTAEQQMQTMRHNHA